MVLTRTEEAKLFIDINTTQRGVPAALLLDIKQLAQQESTLEQSLRSLFDKLNMDSASPLTGKLSSNKSVTGKLSRVTFNRALGPIINGSVLGDLTDSQKYKLILNYLNAFDAEILDKALLVKSAFFEAIFAMFDLIVENSIAVAKDAKQNSIQKIIRPLAKLNYNGTGGKSLLDKKSIALLMQSTLKSKRSIGEEML
ncbi:hypothetical protein [Aestuariivirga sp.]|uniref:hypothetical protein n=1 Tax=Aestuariivirga sp. TaxID=2650926 RepID=UPI0035949185